MRENCEFQTCQCLRFQGRGSRCRACAHGDVWHKNNHSNQFSSPRAPARKPQYVRECVQRECVQRECVQREYVREPMIMPVVMPVAWAMPTAPPLPDDGFCPEWEALPI